MSRRPGERPPTLGTWLAEAQRDEAKATVAGERVFSLAEAAGVFFSHFEYHRPAADPWAPSDRPDLGDTGGWHAGVLPETKFRHFRLDRPVASYHPGQRAKWTAHELCHQVVGFAWWPGMSRLEVACMARLAEALPVALWYFFDDAGRARCPEHRAHDAFSEGFCRRCEAEPGPVDDPAAESRLADGLAFVEREIDGATTSLRTGVVQPTPWCSIDLASDGLAWSAAHGERLASPAFRQWMEAFRGWGDGWRASIDDLVAVVRTLASHLARGTPPLVPVCAPAQRLRADLAWRLLALSASLPARGKRAALRPVLQRAVDQLRDGGPVGGAIAAYRDAQADGLPPLEVALATGYRLAAGGETGPDAGLALSQVGEGLWSALPLTLGRLGDVPAAVRAFAAGDVLERRVLARRFTRSLDPGSLPWALASLESALVDPGPAPLGALSLRADVTPTTPLVMSNEAELVSAPWEVLPAFEGEPPYPAEAAYVVVRGADGEPRIFPLSPWARSQVEAMAGGPVPVPLDDDGERAGLVDAGAWIAAPRAVAG